MQSTSVTCKTCGNLFQGNYCNQCGEKVYDAHDKKLSHFLEETLHFLTHFDTKFFRSFGMLFFKPGLLSKAYAEGRRKNYFSPLSLFLIGVAIYLLFPVLQGMNISFENHINNNNELHFYAVQQWAVNKAHAEHISIKQLAEKFDHLSPKFSKVTLVVLIPLSALMLALLFRRKQLFYFDHLMIAAEFNAFYLFYTFLILPALILLFTNLSNIHIDIGDTILFLSLQGIVVLMVLALALQRFYQVRFLTGLLKGILFIILFLLTIVIYRLLLYSLIMLII